MKKGVIAALLVLALIVLVSPGIVGRLAERSVDENLNWAATKSGELVINSQGFDRRWFSSAGQHRVELGDGAIRAAMADGDLPALIINTRLDHGLIPVSSLTRAGGSLAPGLGSAVSTLSVAYGTGETVAIPGTIYSEIGLGGELHSSYVLDAGSQMTDTKKFSWEPTTINVAINAGTGSVVFSGDVGAISIAADEGAVSVGAMTFQGEQTPTPHGFSVGDVTATVASLTLTRSGTEAVRMQNLTASSVTRMVNGRVNSRSTISLASFAIPAFGDIAVAVDMFVDAEAEALGKVLKKLEAMSRAPDNGQLFVDIEDDLKSLLAAGLDMRFDRLDVTLPMGAVEAKIDFEIPASERATFEWTSLLLSIVASADISVSEELVELAMQMNPLATGALLSMGYLKQSGDDYVLQARYKKGVMTVNGAPIPIPFGMLQ